MRGPAIAAACVLAIAGSCDFTGRSSASDAGTDAAPDAEILPSWRVVAAGNAHTCAIKLDDTLWCWGDNTIGQLGTGRTDEEVTSPVQVGTQQWSAIVAGYQHTCGIQRGGSLWCWGNNTYGQLGIDPGTVIPFAAEPQNVVGTWNSVSAGYFHTCAIGSDQALLCWGPNFYGELGTGDPLTAARVPAKLAGTWSVVTAGYYASCGIQTDGVLACWGFNGYGELGDSTVVDKHAPVAVGVDTWRDVSLTYLHACGLLTDGRLRCWGYNANGQHGDGTLDPHYSPAPLAADDPVWADVATGWLHSCARRIGGSVWCWGNDAHGETTVSPTQTASNPIPTQVAQTSGVFDTIALGYDHTCGVTADHRLWCTGRDGLGQLGSGVGGSALAPEQIPGGWKVVSTQRETTCAHSVAEEFWCWGQNENGQFGNGGYTMRQTPILVAPAGGRISLGVGRNHTCAVGGGNTVYCTGYNGEGSLGDGTLTSRPTYAVVPGLVAASAVVSWRMTSCALPSATTGIWCWGSNAEGQLGTGDKLGRSSPTQQLVADTIVAVDTGRSHTCVVRKDGTLACTGHNVSGQLGIGAAVESLGFADVVSPVTTWSDVATGLNHTCALTLEGALYCWGANDWGKLGDGTTTGSNVPLAIGTATWRAISIGYYHSCGIQTDGSLWCWGSNGHGQLGVAGFTPHATPTLVQAETGEWRAVVVGEQYTCAIRADDTLWCWGANAGGQLGNSRAWRAAWADVR